MGTRIDKIQLKNFKSFKSATLPISSGYTTIIGPNGSGKTNLIDSIVFAVGSTSMKNLRADRLVDLVHRDSKDGTAEVVVGINGEKPMTIARLVDKNGGSVFRLDDKKTAKFAIDETLASMNIHPDGHNIIMQGEVNRIIKMSPLQRREVIDEVSGVAEYEAKKEESLRELSKVEEKVKEASIILNEKKSYLEVLEKEKDEAEYYRDLQNDQHKLKASVVRQELDSADKTVSNANNAIAQARIKLQELLKEKDDENAELARLENEYESLRKKIFEESDRRQLEVRKEIEETRGRILVLEEKMNGQRAVVEKNQANRMQLAQQLSDTGNKISSREKELDLARLEEDDASKNLSAKEEQLSLLLKRSKFGAVRELEELNSQIDECKKKYYQASSDARVASEALKQKKNELDAQNAAVRKALEREKESRERLEKTQIELMRLRQETKTLEEEVIQLIRQERGLSQQLEEADATISVSKDKLSDLNSIVKNVAGFNEAVEAVTKNKTLSGICGTVADLCSYDEKHAAAIETAAGPKLFYVVTKTSDDAINAVKFLKQNQLGRANFIPLDKIKPPATPELPKANGVLDIVLNLVKYDSQYAAALKYVFGDTVAVTTIDAAKNVGIGKHRMVTLDGDLCELSGLVSGGYLKKGTMLGNIKAAGELKTRLAELAESREKTRVELRTAREAVTENREKKVRAELKSSELEAISAELKAKISELEAARPPGVSKLASEIVEMEKILVARQAEQGGFEKQVSQFLEKRNSLVGDKSAEDAAQKIRALEPEVQRLRDQRTERVVRQKTLRTEIEQFLVVAQKNLEIELQKIDGETSAIQDSLKQIVVERNGLVKALKEKEEKERQLATSMDGLYNEQKKVDDSRKELGQKLLNVDKRIEKWKEELGERNVEKARLESRHAELLREWEKFGGSELVDGDLGALRERLSGVEAQLNRFGSVNMKAIELFAQYKKDADEISEKMKKLGAEKAAILYAIDEIERKKLTSFMETFKALNENFNVYFKEFYTEEGAYACLKLEDEQNPLQSGLVVEAKPTGRHIKRIDSMSGGEKTITALAFLFAIQSYKPSPFYILDEVDAALDAENSLRVARMLKKFSKQIQLIIVTHNTHVIQESDQIIGVHMGADGSSVVEVDLKGYGKEKTAALA